MFQFSLVTGFFTDQTKHFVKITSVDGCVSVWTLKYFLSEYSSSLATDTCVLKVSCNGLFHPACWLQSLVTSNYAS